jgi:beta-lactam-binding protein with PASTA domain/D-alanine-D-alanine ligase-like ATP-grasp enzyme
MPASNMNIPIGIFFGGGTPLRDQSLQNAQRVYQQLQAGNFDPLPIFVDPFGQLIVLENGMPTGNSLSDFYPTDKYFSRAERAQFPVYPEQLGSLGDTEKQAMAADLGLPIAYEELGERISIAFLALPDVEHIQEQLTAQRIPYTGESADFSDLANDRYGLRLQLQKNGFEMPAALKLTAKDWKNDSLQAIWGEDTANVAYPLLLRPSYQDGPGRSSVVTSKDGPNGLRRAIDLAFAQQRLSAEDWLNMSPVDRENFIQRLARWASGIGFPLELATGTETIVFQRPKALLDYLIKTTADRPAATYLFRSQRAADDILVSSLPEGTAFSCLLIRDETGSWACPSLRFLGADRAIVAGTEQFPVSNTSALRVSESLAQQLQESAKTLAETLPATSGIRVFGILSADGTMIPEEIQAFTGPNNQEQLSGKALKSFIIASLRARQQENPEPAYRTLLETLRAEDAPLPGNAEAVEAQVAAATRPAANVAPARQVIYEREIEKLNKEKEAMPESVSYQQESPAQEPKPSAGRRIWENIKAFFSSKVFLRNLGAVAVFLLLLFFLLNMGLRLYTKHGDSMQLEDYQGLLLDDARRKAESKGLKMEVISESFQPGKRANEIFAQYPEPLSNVKENRTVFVSVYQDKGKEIVLKPLTEWGDDIDTYRRELGKRKIRTLIQKQVFDAKLAEGTILHLVVDGEKVTNTQLRQGQVKVAEGGTVEAVISTRTSNLVPVPDLVCLKYDAAQVAIQGNFLVMGKVYGGSNANRNEYYVWKQEPVYNPNKLVPKGEQINLYLTPAIPDGCSE